MNTRPARTDLPPALVDRLVEILQRLGITNSASELWETEFSDAERNELGEQFPLEKLYEAYASLRNVSLERAVVELGAAADHITPATRVRMLRQLGEGEKSSFQSTGKPHFDMETGRLFFGGKLLAKFQVRRAATNVFRILEAFEKSGWAQSVVNPLLAEHSVETPIYKVLHQLNRKTQPISFEVIGKRIGWQEKCHKRVSKVT